MPLTAKQISALVDAGATDAEIKTYHEQGAAAAQPAPEMYHPGLSDTPTSAFMKEVGRTAGKTAKGIAESPMDILKGLGQTIVHPIDTATNAGQAALHAILHPIDTASDVVKAASDPETGGRMIGNLTLGELVPRAIGAGGRAIASSPVIQKTLGGVGGAALGSSLGHPYVGFGLGSRYGGDVVGAAAEQAGKMKSLSQMLEAGGGPAEGEIVRGAEMYKPGVIPLHDTINGDVPQPAPRARVSTAAPSMMEQHTPGFTPEVVNPKTASAGTLPAAGDRETMLKKIFGGEDLRDVFNGKGGVQRNILPPEMRIENGGTIGPAIKGDYSNYPQEFTSVGGGTTPPSAGNQNDYNWQKITAPEVPSRTAVPEETAAQLEIASEPRAQFKGLDVAVNPEVAPEGASAAESPVQRLARILGTPSDAEVAASVGKRNTTGSWE